MRPALVASDLDGTLLRPDRSVSPRTTAVLRRLGDAGIPFVVVTGRPPAALPPVIAALRPAAPVVSANGAAVLAPDGRTVLAEHPVPADVLAAEVARLRLAVPAAALAVERGGELLHDARYVAGRPAMRPTRVVDDAELVAGPVLKLLVRLPADAGGEGRARLVADLRGRLEATHSGVPGLVEATAPGVTKATGVAWVAARLGVDPRDVLAFGDMPNDLPMLRWAGCGVAMAHAEPEVLAAANALTGSNSDDGVAAFLEAVLDGHPVTLGRRRTGAARPPGCPGSAPPEPGPRSR